MCLWHKEDTASLAIFETYYKCFGCMKTGPLSDLEAEDLPKITLSNKKVRYTEDIHKELSRIRSLPLKKVRGLDLHCDDTYYYILWHDADYYKKRHITDKKSKYRCPSGYQKPLFVTPGSYPDLLIVEGEINALTVYLMRPDLKIISPGGCNDFLRYKYYYLEYRNIFLAHDADQAGTLGALKFRDEMKALGKRVHLVPLSKDYNDILTMDGEIALRREIEKISTMQRELQALGIGKNMPVSRFRTA